MVLFGFQLPIGMVKCFGKGIDLSRTGQPINGKQLFFHGTDVSGMQTGKGEGGIVLDHELRTDQNSEKAFSLPYVPRVLRFPLS